MDCSVEVWLTLSLARRGPSVQQTPRNFALPARVHFRRIMHGQHSAVPYPIRNKPMKRDMQCGPEKIALSLVHRHFATVFAVFTKLLRYWWAGSKWRIKAAISVFMPGLESCR